MNACGFFWYGQLCPTTQLDGWKSSGQPARRIIIHTRHFFPLEALMGVVVMHEDLEPKIWQLYPCVLGTLSKKP